MIVVSNSGPIISFARAGYLDLLRELFQVIVIPKAVYEEIAIIGSGKAGAEEVMNEEWFKRMEVRD